MRNEGKMYELEQAELAALIRRVLMACYVQPVSLHLGDLTNGRKPISSSIQTEQNKRALLQRPHGFRW